MEDKWIEICILAGLNILTFFVVLMLNALTSYCTRGEDTEQKFRKYAPKLAQRHKANHNRKSLHRVGFSDRGAGASSISQPVGILKKSTSTSTLPLAPSNVSHLSSVGEQSTVPVSSTAQASTAGGGASISINDRSADRSQSGSSQ